MNARQFTKWCATTAVVALGMSLTWNEAAAQAVPPPAGAEAGVQVLTRGPVHEAFAETVTFDPEPGIKVPKVPPADIEEIPPTERPAGANVAWIPGYFAWDDERNDFLWVSGIWRSLPPGRQWVPGYWAKSESGAQWTTGYWADAKVAEVQYLPEPPQSVEAGPSVAATSDDQSWLPGTWIWQQNRYAWRPGYWAAMNADWDWVPPHYVWRPRGYLFVDGYYDYSVARRGMLFAPVYFDASVYSRRGFSFSPSIAINGAVLANNLFVRPSYQSYYFGDYYGANYGTAGFYPSYSYNSGRFGYDPIYAHDHWEHRQDPNWDRGNQTRFQNLRDNENARPPRTWAAQQASIQAGTSARGNGIVMAAPLDQLSRSKDNPLRLQPVTAQERQSFGQNGTEMQQFRQNRQKLEINPTTGAAAAPGARPEPSRLQLPRSPIVAAPLDRTGTDRALPKAHDYPKADPKIEPRPRKAPVNQPPGRVAPNATPATPRTAPNPIAPTPSRSEPAAPRAATPRPAPQPASPAPARAEPKAEAPKPEQPKPEGPKGEPQREPPKR